MTTAGPAPTAARAGRTTRERWVATRAGLGPYVRPHRRQLVVALVASGLVTAAQLALPWPLKGLVELTLTPVPAGAGGSSPDLGAGSPVWWLAAALVLLGLVLGFAEQWQRLAVSRFVVPVVNDARVGIFTKLVRSAPVGAAGADAGDVFTRVITDTSRLRVGMKGVLVHVLQHGLFLVGVCVVLVVVDVRLGLVYLAGLVVALAVASSGTLRTAVLARASRAREGRLAGEVFRAAGSSGARLGVKDAARSRPVARITQVKGRTSWVVQGVLAVTACAVLMVSVRLAETERLGTGDVALVASYLLMLHYPVMRLGRQVTRLGPQLVGAERLALLAESGRDRGDRR